MSSISLLSGAESIATAVAPRNLKKHAEDALRLVFASGCMVLVNNLTEVDPHSYKHAKNTSWDAQ